MVRPDGPGAWMRHWVGRGGIVKRRPMVLHSNGTVTDLRAGPSFNRPLSWYDGRPGCWTRIARGGP